MSRAKERLSNVKCNNAKPAKHKKTGALIAARYADGGGLYLHVSATGKKRWVYVWTKTDLSGNRKRHEAGLGSFGKRDVTLEMARDKAAKYREMIRQGKNPIAERRHEEKIPTFGECVDRFYADKVEYKVLPDGKTSGLKSEKSRRQFRMTMEVYAKSLSDIPVDKITRDDILKVLRPIWDTKRETASRTQQRIERIISYATAYGWREGPNPAKWVKGLDNILAARPTAKEQKNHPALDYKEMPEFMAKLRAIDTITARCLEYIILTVARSKQGRTARFCDIDQENIWNVPAPDMKGGIDFTVPLSSRAIEIVDHCRDLPPSELLFPNPNSRKMLSENATRVLLIKMGFGHVTTHGFRATYRTYASAETSFSREIIEWSMAHKVGDSAEQAYIRQTAHDKRRALMQAWSDYCAGKQSGEIVRLHG